MAKEAVSNALSDARLPYEAIEAAVSMNVTVELGGVIFD